MSANPGAIRLVRQLLTKDKNQALTTLHIDLLFLHVHIDYRPLLRKANGILKNSSSIQTYNGLRWKISQGNWNFSFSIRSKVTIQEQQITHWIEEKKNRKRRKIESRAPFQSECDSKVVFWGPELYCLRMYFLRRWEESEVERDAWKEDDSNGRG